MVEGSHTDLKWRDINKTQLTEILGAVRLRLIWLETRLGLLTPLQR